LSARFSTIHACQRALAQLIGGEPDPSAGVAAHVHRFDRRDTLDRKQLRSDAVQEAGAPGLIA
jgi:hypothetical protein